MRRAWRVPFGDTGLAPIGGRSDPALLREPRLHGIRAAAEVSFPVTDEGHGVGEYSAGIRVEDVLLIELKCVERLFNEDAARCLNYRRASGRTLPFCQFPETQGRVEANCLRFQIPEPIDAPPLAG